MASSFKMMCKNNWTMLMEKVYILEIEYSSPFFWGFYQITSSTVCTKRILEDFKQVGFVQVQKVKRAKLAFLKYHTFNT